ncbi:hypothetical protein [Leptolyngbya sp. FACHB-261]|uniref:hypothetical protein n=1 Tax=Leptolyngbya sp. FACHB-261 TaxID=2692806 RepID=UPI0016877F70|nr:hypothetical protein [Leptolyngbya sp. FACHB-261]MBD2105184.1 hypothetical protein [Leptolyngbya sp. FACHB-261]
MSEPAEDLKTPTTRAPWHLFWITQGLLRGAAWAQANPKRAVLGLAFVVLSVQTLGQVKQAPPAQDQEPIVAPEAKAPFKTQLAQSEADYRQAQAQFLQTQTRLDEASLQALRSYLILRAWSWRDQAKGKRTQLDADDALFFGRLGQQPKFQSGQSNPEQVEYGHGLLEDLAIQLATAGQLPALGIHELPAAESVKAAPGTLLIRLETARQAKVTAMSQSERWRSIAQQEAEGDSP